MLVDIAGKTVLITGSTDGVGKVVAFRLADAGARVLLHGRSGEKGEYLLDAIRRDTGKDRLEYFRADFSSLDEVRRLAEEVMLKHSQLELLINNAGIGFTTYPRQTRARDEP
jgi:NAD(P)-dependent dehydrogenase (short-subunit alcohol dehydrogenase family)